MNTTRRQFLRGAGLFGAGSVAVSALSGCSSAVAAGLTGAPSAPDLVRYWHLFTGGDGARMQDMVGGFRKEHDEIELRDTTLEWGAPYYTKLSLATVGNRPPDVAITHLSRLPTLVRAGLVRQLGPRELAPYGLTADRFAETPWEKSHVDGGLYALPLDVHPYALYYNTEICDKAGLLDGDGKLKPIDGASGFVDALREAKSAGGQWGGIVPLVADPASVWRYFDTLYSQTGGKVLADRGTRVILDLDRATEVLDYMVRLSRQEKLIPPNLTYEAAVASFTNGQAGFFLNGVWELTSCKEAGLPFDMMSFPQLFPEQHAVWADSHAFVIPTQEGSPDAALTFIRGMLGQSLTWSQGGSIPAWLPVRDSDTYRSSEPQSNYVDSTELAVYDPAAWYSGSGSRLEDLGAAAVLNVITGRTKPRAAARQMHADLARFANTPSPII